MEREVQGRLRGLRVHREWFDFGGGDPVIAVRDAIADIKSPPPPDAKSAERQRRLREKADAARGALKTWGDRRRRLEDRRRRLDAERDTLVVAALDAGLIKEEVHVITGLGRTTIDRIAKKNEEDKP